MSIKKIINNLSPKRLFSSWIAFCILLSVSGYLLDLFFHFEFALERIDFLGLYFFIHLFGQFYIILPVFILYFFLFGRTQKSLILKLVFISIIAVLLENFLRPDDWNMYTGDYKRVKQIFIYIFSAVSTVLIDEYYLKK